MSRLTPKQEKFCLEYMKDGNASRAYREAYNTSNMKPESIHRKAKEVIDNGNVRARIDELQKEINKPTILNIQERKEILTKIAQSVSYDKDGNPSYTDARGAIDILNKMDAVYIQKNQTELTSNGPLFQINLKRDK